MKRYLSIAIALLVIVSITMFFESCRKTNISVTINKENILDSNAHIIDTLSIQAVSEGSVTLDKTQLKFNVAVGSILLASPSSKDTMGMLVKVTRITNNGNLIECTTQPSNLNEAFSQLYIDHVYNESFNVANKGTSGSGLGFSINHNKTIAAGYAVTGNLELNFPQTRVKFVKKRGKLLPDTVLVAQDFNTKGSKLDLQVTALQTGEVTWFDSKDLPAGLPTILIPIPVGPVVFILPLKQRVKLSSLPASISGSAKFKVFPTISATLGASYMNGDWTNLSTFSIDAGADPFRRKDFDEVVSATITFFNPTYELDPYGLDEFKMFFSVPNKLKLKIQYPSPNYSLKYTLSILAGIKAEFWTGAIKANYSKEVSAPDVSILEGDFCDNNIGDTAFGGIIFYLKPGDCKHGYVCSINDVSSGVLSGPYQIGIIGGFSNDIGMGQPNTTRLVGFATASYPVQFYAAQAAVAFGSGWFLPSKDELNELYKAKSKIGNLTGIYWSSSMVPDICVWAQNFDNGTQSNYYPDGVTSFKVRAIKEF